MSANVVGNFAVLAAAIPSTISPIVYARVQWWRSKLGRHLMIYMVTIAVVLDLSVVRIFISENEAFQWVRLGAFTAVVASLWWRLWVVYDAQRRHRKQKVDVTVKDRESHL